jgi:hypothetical protein
MIIRKFQKRLLNPYKIEDYFFLTAVGSIPVIYSFIIGIWENYEKYKGFKNYINFISLIFIAPISLFLLREVSSLLFGFNIKSISRNSHQRAKYFLSPISPLIIVINKIIRFCRKIFLGLEPQEDSLDNVPILTLFKERKVKIKIFNTLRKKALNQKIFYTVFTVNTVFTIVDTWDILKLYSLKFVGQEIEQPIEWTNIFLIRKDINIFTNIIFNFFVYLSQYLTTFIGFMVIALFLVHNIFYLNLIYQRSNVPDEKIKYHFVLDFEDPSRRFGLKYVYPIFNLQIYVLIISGCFLLFSRLIVVKTREPF